MHDSYRHKVNYLNIGSLTRFPAGTCSPLAIHANAVLAYTSTRKFYQAISRISADRQFGPILQILGSFYSNPKLWESGKALSKVDSGAILSESNNGSHFHGAVRDAGYDEDNNNWFWAKYAPDGSLDKCTKGMMIKL